MNEDPTKNDELDFLERMRGLDEPAPRREFGAQLRARILRRAHLGGLSARTLAPRTLRERVQAIWLRVEATVRASRAARVLVLTLSCALVALGGLSLWSSLQHATQERDARAVFEGERAAVLPVVEEDASAASLWRGATTVERLQWLASQNDLERLARSWGERGRVELRRRLRKLGGADERTRMRIEALASDVAVDVLLRAASSRTLVEYRDVEAFALGVRALLGSGSTRDRGPQQAAVRRGLSFLEVRLSDLRGPELATALVPCLEAALMADGDSLAVVGEQIARLVEQELAAFDLARPKPFFPERRVPLDRVFRVRARFACERDAEPRFTHTTSWLGRIDTPNGAIADAGLLLRVAPALGTPVSDVLALRSALDAVLQRRSEIAGPSGAAARAARLLAFADEEDERRDLRRALRGYRIHPDRFGRDIRALVDLAWGVFPGSGWARFNRALRYVTANYDDETPRERAGLLLVQLLWTDPAPIER